MTDVSSIIQKSLISIIASALSKCLLYLFPLPKIETEKRFEPKIAYIDFKLDIFAESKDQRIVVEIQRMEYDYNFDRFLHYFLMTIAELQRSSREYGIDKTVYTIVVLTAPYKVQDKDGRLVKNEVLISKLNPRNLKGEEIDLFGHQLVFLNSYHRDDYTTPAYRDWLDLIYQSIHHAENPKINLSNPAIKRVSEIIDVDNLTPEERSQSKQDESSKAAVKFYHAQALKEGMDLEKVQIIKALIAQDILTDDQIAKVAETSIDVIKAMRENPNKL